MCATPYTVVYLYDTINQYQYDKIYLDFLFETVNHLIDGYKCIFFTTIGQNDTSKYQLLKKNFYIFVFRL